jgi:hypothetical protein
MPKFGDMLYVSLTEEPTTFIFSRLGLSIVRRPIMGRNGIRHRFGWFFNKELETLQEQTARTVATIQARNSIAESEFGQSGAAMPALPFKKSN